MKKLIICIFIAIFLISTVFCAPASAYTLSSDMKIHADTVILKNLETNMTVYSQNVDKKVYPASLTKLMTALVVLDKVPNIKTVVTAGENVINDLLGSEASIIMIQPGEQLTVEDLLYGLLVSSGCDAANVLAEHVSGNVTEFVKEMNAKAVSLGMTNTNYANAHGLHSEEQYTTTADLEKLGLAVIQNETLLKICGSARHTIPATNKSEARILATTNFLLDPNTSYYYKRVKGLKTGFTDQAGRCLMTYAEKDGQRYLCIVTGCPDKDESGNSVRYDFEDTFDLLYWAYTQFEYVCVAESNYPAAEVNVKLCSDHDFVLAVTKEELCSIIPINSKSSVIVEPHLTSETVEAPIKKGDVLGYAEILCSGEKLGRVDLVAAEDCDRSFVLLVTDRTTKFLFHPITIVILSLIILAIVAFVVLNIRTNIIKNRMYDEKIKRRDNQ